MPCFVTFFEDNLQVLGHTRPIISDKGELIASNAAHGGTVRLVKLRAVLINLVKALKVAIFAELRRDLLSAVRLFEDVPLDGIELDRAVARILLEARLAVAVAGHASGHNEFVLKDFTWREVISLVAIFEAELVVCN